MGIKKVKCAIVSGAPDTDTDFLRNHIDSGSFVIAADSGYVHCLKAGIRPDLIIGDFDSSPQPDVDVELIKLPVEKNDTDTFYCVKEAISRGYNSIEIFCALGNRVDHTYSNLLCLEYCLQNKIRAEIINSKNKIFLINDSVVLNDKEYKYFSLFALFSTVYGLNIIDARYELTDYNLAPDCLLTQSNAFIGKEVKINLKKGVLMIIQCND